MLHKSFIRKMFVFALCCPLWACSGDDDDNNSSADLGEPTGGTANSDAPGDSADPENPSSDSDSDDLASGGSNTDTDTISDPDIPEETANNGESIVVPGENPNGTDPVPAVPPDMVRPLVFVHDAGGSSNQFESQAIRLAANGFPTEQLYSFEHDGSAGVDQNELVSELDDVIDGLREEFDVEQVYLVAHGRGTEIANAYIANPQTGVKLSKYVALDGQTCPVTLPCMSLMAEGDEQFGTTPLEGHTHVEVATSPVSFGNMFEYLFEAQPAVVDIVPQRSLIRIGGRAVNYPENSGIAGANLDVWQVDDNGRRVGNEPVASLVTNSDGRFGPVEVDPNTHYEHELYFDGSNRRHHFYAQPYLRDTGYVRLYSGEPSEEAMESANPSDDHSTITLVRQREWTPEDVLRINTQSAHENGEIENLLTEDFSPSIAPVAITIEDDAETPGESSLTTLSYFEEQLYQAGVDGYIPAAPEPDGTVVVTNLPRGDAENPQVIRFPNWASSEHSITVLFSDYPR